MYSNVFIYLYIYLLAKFFFVDNEFFIVYGLLVFLAIISFKLKVFIREQFHENIIFLSGNILDFTKVVTLFFFNWLILCSCKINYIKRICSSLFLITGFQYKSFKLSNLTNSLNSSNSFLLLTNCSTRLSSLLLINMLFQMLVNNNELSNNKQQINFILGK